jgi:hypothetical protein
MVQVALNHAKFSNKPTGNHSMSSHHHEPLRSIAMPGAAQDTNYLPPIQASILQAFHQGNDKHSRSLIQLANHKMHREIFYGHSLPPFNTGSDTFTFTLKSYCPLLIIYSTSRRKRSFRGSVGVSNAKRVYSRPSAHSRRVPLHRRASLFHN